MSRYAQGGIITSPTGDSDSVPVLLSDGCDYRLSAREVRLIGQGVLKRINDALPVRITEEQS